MDALRHFISTNPLLAASLSSLWGAVLIDLMSFRASKEPGNFLAQFNVRVAGARYLQAFIGGFVGNAVTVGLVAGAGAVTALAIWW